MQKGMVLGLAALVGLAGAAWAGPPRADELGYDPSLSAWFRSLRAPGSGQRCCDAADCRAVEYRITPDGYEIHPLAAYDDRIRGIPHMESRWTRVPPAVVLRVENPAGQAIACYGLRWEYQSTAPDLNILCFSPPSGV